MRVRIVADDLTGAADAGVAFAGGTAKLALSPGEAWSGNCPAAAVDADSRDCAASAARTRVDDCARALRTTDVVLAKVDSMLRGHLRAELEVMRDHLPDRPVLLAPALPAQGRVTRQGRQYVRGGRTVRPAPALADRLAPLPVRVVELAEVRRGPDALAGVLSSRRYGGIVACDAETDADLDAIVAAGMRLPQPPLWAGSAGLAHALARALVPAAVVSAGPGPSGPDAGGVGQASGVRHRDPTSRDHAGEVGRRLLAVLGSTSRQAVRQVRELVAAGVQGIEVPAGVAAGADGPERRWWSERIRRAAQSGHTVVRVTGPATSYPARQVAVGLAGLTSAAVATAGVLLLSGGATARAALGTAGVRQLRLLGELEAGVVVAAAETGHGCGRIVTKAGAFGDDRTLVRILANVEDGRMPR